MPIHSSDHSNREKNPSTPITSTILPSPLGKDFPLKNTTVVMCSAKTRILALCRKSKRLKLLMFRIYP